MKALLDAGLLHGDALTVTGKTVAAEPPRHRAARPRRRGHPRDERPDPPHRRADDPARLARARGRGGEERRASTASISRAPPGCSTASRPRWRRSAAGALQPGDVVVIRWEGPEGRSGDARDVADHQRDQGGRARQGRHAADRRPVLRRNHRSVRRARRPRSCGRWPDRAGAATATASGSTCAPARSTCSSTPTELERRRADWKPLPPRFDYGVLGKYAKLVGSAADGAVCG